MPSTPDAVGCIHPNMMRCSTTVLLSRVWEVEQERDRCWANKLYRKAQQLENEVNQIKRVLEDQKLHELDAEHAKQQAANDAALQQSLQEQLQQWSSQVHSLHLQLQAADQQMLARHAEEVAAAQAAEPRHPKFSPDVLNLRHIEKSLAGQKEYSKAAKVKQQADKLEQMELHEHQADWASKCAAVMARLQEKHAREKEAAAKKASSALLAARQRQELEDEQVHKRYQAAKLALTRSQAAQRLALQQSLRGSLGLAKPSTLLHLPSLNSSLADTREIGLPSSAWQKHHHVNALHANSSQGSSRASSPTPAYPESSRASSPSPVQFAGSGNGSSKLRHGSQVPDKLPAASVASNSSLSPSLNPSLSPNISWMRGRMQMPISSNQPTGRRSSAAATGASPGAAATDCRVPTLGTSSKGRAVSCKPHMTPYITSQLVGSRGGARGIQGTGHDRHSLHLQPLAAQAARPATSSQAQVGRNLQCAARTAAHHTLGSCTEANMSQTGLGINSCTVMGCSASCVVNCSEGQHQRHQQHMHQQQQVASTHQTCSNVSGSTALRDNMNIDMSDKSKYFMATAEQAGVCAASEPVMDVALAVSAVISSNPGAPCSSSCSSDDCPGAICSAKDDAPCLGQPQGTGPAMFAGIQEGQAQKADIFAGEGSTATADVVADVGARQSENVGNCEPGAAQAGLPLMHSADGPLWPSQGSGSCSATLLGLS